MLTKIHHSPMNSPVTQSVLSAVLVMSLGITGCSEKPEATAAYQAVCEGPPLRTMEMRNKALEDGYGIIRHFDCIDKASFAAIREQKARWDAAHTPEALARTEAEYAETRALYAEKRAREAAAAESAKPDVPAEFVLRNIDVNTATETDIASVISVGPQVAAQIVEQRNQRRFNDWADLVRRVVGLSAAQTAVYASTCGLTVDGKSLDGAPPNAATAASLARRYQGR
jgi:DNA uptake protein ComE-like DNA-binding protein